MIKKNNIEKRRQWRQRQGGTSKVKGRNNIKAEGNGDGDGEEEVVQ